MIYEDELTLEEFLDRLPKSSKKSSDFTAFVFPYTTEALGKTEERTLAEIVARLVREIDPSK